MRFCQACGLDHDRHAGQIASSVTGCSCVLSEAHLQDRAPRCAVVLALPSPQAPYRASGLVHWHFCDITTGSGYVRLRGSKRPCGRDRWRTEPEATATLEHAMTI